MNLSKVISTLIMQYKLYEIALPFKDEVTGKPIPTENIVRDILVTTTIPMFSQFQPWLREGNANVNHLKIVDKRNSIYMLPAFLTSTPIMYVSDVHLPLQSNRGTYGDIAPSYGINASVQGVLTSQAYMMLAGQMRSEPSFDYKGENKIQLYGYPKTILTFCIACEHEPNGETIPQGCYHSFLQLASLDLKVFLYNTLKLYDGIPTAFGAIQLKIEEYQGAEAERTDLLEKWNDVFHLDMNWEQFM